MTGLLEIFKVLLIFLVVHRLTRLAVADEIPVVKVPREWLVSHLDPDPGKPPNPLPQWYVALTFTTTALLGVAVAVCAEVGWVGAGIVAGVAAMFALLLGLAAYLPAVGRSVAYLLECPWCMSVWVGAGVVWLTADTVGVVWPWLVWAASSSVTGLIGAAESAHDQRYELAELELDRRRAEAQRPVGGRR